MSERKPLTTRRLSEHCTLNIYQDEPHELEAEFSVFDGFETMSGMLVNPCMRMLTPDDPELEDAVTMHIAIMAENGLPQLVEDTIARNGAGGVQ